MRCHRKWNKSNTDKNNSIIFYIIDFSPFSYGTSQWAVHVSFPLTAYILIANFLSSATNHFHVWDFQPIGIELRYRLFAFFSRITAHRWGEKRGGEECWRYIWFWLLLNVYCKWMFSSSCVQIIHSTFDTHLVCVFGVTLIRRSGESACSWNWHASKCGEHPVTFCSRLLFAFWGWNFGAIFFLCKFKNRHSFKLSRAYLNLELALKNLFHREDANQSN